MANKFGSVPLSSDILSKANIGLWAFELDAGQPSRMYVDEAMLGLFGLTEQKSPEEIFRAWYDRVDEGSYGLIQDAMEKMAAAYVEVQYPWHHPDGRTVIVRCGGVRNPAYTKGIRIEGTHQNVSAVLRYDEEERERLRAKEIELKHAEFRASALGYLTEHEGDIASFLDFFASRLRELIKCDQVIYMNTKEETYINNSPELGKDFEIPHEYCLQCNHYDPFAPIYAKGVAEMSDKRKGVDGVLSHKNCPVKSALTRIVYLDGKVNGYLAIHYILDYHKYTDYERQTLEEFANLLSLSLSRHAARVRNAENDARLFALEDTFLSLYDVELESGYYTSFERDDFYKRNISDNVVSMTEFFKDLRTNVDRVVYEEDREATFVVQQKENIIKALAEKDHIDHYYRVITENGPLWLKMRIVYKNAERKNIVIGIFNAEEEMAARQKEEAFREELAQTNARLFALEDNFESLYDVEMESGYYEVFVRGDFFKNNVLNKLSVPKDYFAELRANIDAVIYEEDRDGLYNTLTRESIRRELAENERFDYLYRVNSVNGPVWLKIRIVYKDAEKKNIIIGVFNAEKDVEAQQLAEALSMAKAANEAKSSFLFNMSHDIRTPMNAITGFTAMAKKYLDDKEKAADYLNKIDASGKQLLSLVNQVLEMARIESGKIVFDDAPINIKEKYETMVTIFEEQAQVYGLEFRHCLKNVTHFNILADDARMSQITLNIVGNALKYTPEGGVIEFNLEEKPCERDGFARYTFTVADTGIGMSEDFLQTLFDPFTREKTSTVSRIQGTGLGMSIVKSLVDLAGGTIEVQSEPGKGTRFDITLDFRIAEEVRTEAAVETGTEAEKHSLEGKRILLVEDNELNREIAKDILEELGFAVEEADDGDVAVNLVRQKGVGYYDCVLMDIQMPQMDGYEATKEIRKLQGAEKMPIIALSANAFEEDKQKSLDAGMNDHVAKPIDVSTLVTAMAKFL